MSFSEQETSTIHEQIFKQQTKSMELFSKQKKQITGQYRSYLAFLKLWRD